MLKNSIQIARNAAKKNLEVKSQAENMKKSSDKKFATVSVGETVIIPIPDVETNGDQGFKRCRCHKKCTTWR